MTGGVAQARVAVAFAVRAAVRSSGGGGSR